MTKMNMSLTFVTLWFQNPLYLGSKYFIYIIFPGVIGYYALSFLVLRRPILSLENSKKKILWLLVCLAPAQIMITVFYPSEHNLCRYSVGLILIWGFAWRSFIMVSSLHWNKTTLTGTIESMYIFIINLCNRHFSCITKCANINIFWIWWSSWLMTLVILVLQSVERHHTLLIKVMISGENCTSQEYQLGVLLLQHDL